MRRHDPFAWTCRCGNTVRDRTSVCVLKDDTRACPKCWAKERSKSQPVLELTGPEITAIAKLKLLGEAWPKSLKLFSRSGSLVVLKPGEGRTIREATVAEIRGIPNDGGDPNDSDPA